MNAQKTKTSPTPTTQTSPTPTTQTPPTPTTQTPPTPTTQTPPTPTTQTSPTPICGLEVVGRGIYLRPHQPYELKDILFKQDLKQDHNRTWTSPYSREAGKIGQTYAIPEGYEVNDSPPMPTDQVLNRTLVEESWERFDKQLGLNTTLAASNAMFSIGMNSGQVSNLRSEQDSYYALRSSFIPLWSVYVLPEIAHHSETFQAFQQAVKEDVPLDDSRSFSHDYRREYDKFFDRFGTHYVKSAWIGGKAMTAFIVGKSSEMTKQQIQAGIQASFGGLGSVSNSKDLQESKEKLQNNSECRVFGQGGNELKLAKLSSPDKASYDAWVETIGCNPQVIELEVAGIWTLIEDDEEKAAALLEAYREATTFKPINAIFSKERSSEEFDLRFKEASDDKSDPEIIRELFQQEFGSKKKLAVLIVSAPSHPKKWTLAGFDDNEKFKNFVLDESDKSKDDKPKELDKLSKELLQKGPRNERRIFELAARKLDLTSIISLDRLIFFVRNDWYFCYNLDMGETTTPAPITEIIPELKKDEFAQFQCPDIAFTAAYLDLKDKDGNNLNGKTFLFKRDKCIQVDIATRKIDWKEPEPITKIWRGIDFDRIDAVLNAGPNSLYFFRGKQYIRFNTVAGRADEGYPADIIKRWKGVIFDRIDAAIYWRNNKVYFFKDNQYIRYDMTIYEADPGYPKFIPSNYVQDLEIFL